MEENETETLTLPVLGMTCAACQRHVEDALRSTEGVESARVDLMAHRASVVYDPEVADAEILIDAIRSVGYDAVMPRGADSDEEDDHRASEAVAGGKAWITLIAGALAMLASMPLATHVNILDSRLMKLVPQLYQVPHDDLRWSLLILSFLLMVWAGRSIYLSAARGLVHGTTNMNTLVSLGTGVAFLYSAYATVWPASNHQVYYDAVLLILGFLLLGKALEARAKRRALKALNQLSRLRPATARLLSNGSQSIVPLSEIKVDDQVLVLPGERFPVDAEIVSGITTVDESMLTGESTPQRREAGDRVLSGSLNYDGSVICSASSLGESTMLAQITRMVQAAQSSRAPMERLADRASSIFVPTVLVLAAITFAIWMITTGSMQMALANTVAVLVIACPCAMGLAVPAALTVAVGRGAQLGVLFKGGEALERLANLDVVALDKTGTITVGHPGLISVQPFAMQTEEDLLRLAAAAEEQSNHPLAHAVVDYARKHDLMWSPAQNVKILPGRGLMATVEDYNCVLGNDDLFRELFGRIPDNVPPPKPGVTRLWMALDDHAVGCFDARDTLRPDAVEAVEALHDDGLRVVMLTGDTNIAAAPIAQQVGINEVVTGLDPAGKLAQIRSLQKRGLRVAMVGDGINDAGALAQADAGIALGTGADLAQEAGDVLLLRTRPTGIPAAIDLAGSTLGVMRQNLIWAVAYNILGIPLAAGALYPAFHILLSPWVASAAMALSSVSVLANSLRLRRWRPASVTVGLQE